MMKMLCDYGPLIFSRLERARLEHEIRKAMMVTWAYWCATVGMVLVAAVILWRVCR
jgi:hypothetical protein